MTYTIGKGQARVWTCSYQYRSAQTAEEAIEFATFEAQKDVPGAAVEVLRVKQTPTGRFTVTVKRTMEEVKS